jgi:hypothetical protein
MENIIDYILDGLLFIYKAVVDAIAVIWPSTPESMKLATVLANYSSNPFYYYIIEVAYVAAAVLAVLAVYKLIKVLPFT